MYVFCYTYIHTYIHTLQIVFAIRYIKIQKNTHTYSTCKLTTFIFHFAEHEVGGSIHDAHYFGNLVGEEVTLQCMYDGNSWEKRQQ